MVVDYSKWDKIELSDDSDVEVHPNVDKRSFIRWKQQSIHEKRMQRNQDIKNLETQLNMYQCLNKRVDKLLNQVNDGDDAKFLTDKDKISKFLNENFDKNEKSTGENVDPDIVSYNEMVEDLFDQLKRDAVKEGKDPQNGKVIKELILKHRAKIESVSKEAQTKLQELYIEKNAHISSEDIHTGFDTSFINKNSTSTEKAMSNGRSTNVNSEEDSKKVLEKMIHSTAKKTKDASRLQFIEYTDEADILKLSPKTEEFGSIIANDYKKSEAFLLNNMEIISGQQKDALMMKSFEVQMELHDDLKTYQIIHQSEILAYIREIYDLKKIPFLNPQEMENIITTFFGKVILNPSNQRGLESFLDSVKTKFEHVKSRCKILANEEGREGGDEVEGVEGVETIQLKSLDDSTELEVNLPDFGSEKEEDKRRIEAFKKLPIEMQNAVKTQNLNEVNKVFEDIPIKEAEEILELFGEAEIIGVRAILDDENDFRKLQNEYKNNNDISFEEGNDSEKTQDRLENLSLEQEDTHTEDVVD
ncbi:Hsp90 co-chaperone CDC37 NDAI_0J00760 [Naumovozyma dairenensis CBS 421]|uniref:Hsp90 chaperone protein kinase-targeting subunit n=1 Tax=Naumovozyma dairenensis (strain ATCC 10597 / BCRC 20456 / CBS 421 / NBRC 0211 / NRRL Y-12639) TaxID=1071378 RepID=G0WGP0_NAUDC|nr:hypothetical protein NDAI_0J00760 [Naumovozyma dairenensis CBS 421]CCD26968.1 hypothetical protein NDAI_0J00760 [Naumovozyma dairenensis CBS 421]